MPIDSPLSSQSAFEMSGLTRLADARLRLEASGLTANLRFLSSAPPKRSTGPAPLSEPESRYLHDEIERFQPHLVVSIHAPYGVLDYDGPGTPPPSLGRLYLDQVGIFPGSLGHYGGVHKGIPVVTVELPSAFRTPLAAEMRRMWVDLLTWMCERVLFDHTPEVQMLPVKAKKPV